MKMRPSCACFLCCGGLGLCVASKPRSSSPGGMRNESCLAQSTCAPGIGLCGALPTCGREQFQAFLRRLRRSYKGRPIWLLLDEAPCHIAPRSKALARALGIELIFLPKQCSELNAMDHLWREVKDDISANYQFQSVDEHAEFAEEYILRLSNRRAQQRAGILSKNFWLRAFLN